MTCDSVFACYKNFLLVLLIISSIALARIAYVVTSSTTHSLCAIGRPESILCAFGFCADPVLCKFTSNVELIEQAITEATQTAIEATQCDSTLLQMIRILRQLSTRHHVTQDLQDVLDLSNFLKEESEVVNEELVKLLNNGLPALLKKIGSNMVQLHNLLGTGDEQDNGRAQIENITVQLRKISTLVGLMANRVAFLKTKVVHFSSKLEIAMGSLDDFIISESTMQVKRLKRNPGLDQGVLIMEAAAGMAATGGAGAAAWFSAGLLLSNPIGLAAIAGTSVVLVGSTVVSVIIDHNNEAIDNKLFERSLYEAAIEVGRVVSVELPTWKNSAEAWKLILTKYNVNLNGIEAAANYGLPDDNNLINKLMLTSLANNVQYLGHCSMKAAREVALIQEIGV